MQSTVSVQYLECLPWRPRPCFSSERQAKIMKLEERPATFSISMPQSQLSGQNVNHLLTSPPYAFRPHVHPSPTLAGDVMFTEPLAVGSNDMKRQHISLCQFCQLLRTPSPIAHFLSSLYTPHKKIHRQILQSMRFNGMQMKMLISTFFIFRRNT